MRDFRKILAWQKADDLAVMVCSATRQHFPPHEPYGMISQMRRAAVSVPVNVAEGSGKRYLTEFRQYLYAARASLSEHEYTMHPSERLGYLTDPVAQALSRACAETARILQGFIESFEGQTARGRRDNEDAEAL
jgi:four helix bundle protein